MSKKIENPYYANRCNFYSTCNMPSIYFFRKIYRLGTNLISEALGGNEVYYYDWILKLLFTIATLAIGFQGGEVTPLFSIGATLGVVLGSLLGISPIVCGALGLCSGIWKCDKYFNCSDNDRNRSIWRNKYAPICYRMRNCVHS